MNGINEKLKLNIVFRLKRKRKKGAKTKIN